MVKVTKIDIILFAVVFAMTVVCGFVANAFTVDKVSILAVSFFGGVLSTMAIGSWAEITKTKISKGIEPCALGVVAGFLTMLILSSI